MILAGFSCAASKVEWRYISLSYKQKPDLERTFVIRAVMSGETLRHICTSQHKSIVYSVLRTGDDQEVKPCEASPTAECDRRLPCTKTGS